MYINTFPNYLTPTATNFHKYCTNCGTPNNKYRYCPNCGTPHFTDQYPTGPIARPFVGTGTITLGHSINAANEVSPPPQPSKILSPQDFLDEMK